MSTVIENIERIETAKVNIKTAIVNKGVAVPETATLDAYPDLIGQIQGGGGGGITAEMMRDMGFGGSTFSELPDMFQNADWSLKNNMEYCFYKSGLTSINLPSLPSVTNMSNCFGSCGRLTSISLPTELTSVTNMYYCFANCANLTSLTLPEIPNVTNMNFCFNFCQNLKTLSLPDLPKVNATVQCFYFCKNLENLTIGNLNPSVSSWTQWALSDCTKLTVDSLVNVLNALPERTGTNTCTIGSTNLNKLSEEQKAIATNKGWTLN